MKQLHEPPTDIIKDTFQDITKTKVITCKENNKALSNLNKTLLEIMNDRGTLASYLFSQLSEISNSEHNS